MMDDYWNTSDTTSSKLDNFFDEESDINWRGSSIEESPITTKLPYSGDNNHSSTQNQCKSHKPSLSSGSLTSILDNISINSDPGIIAGISGNKVKIVGKSIGEKIETWKAPSVSIKWKNDGSSSCIQCNSKDEEIVQLRSRLERAYSRYHVTLLPVDTVNKILLGMPYSLENYRMMDEKIALLEAALSSMDSSAIIAILIFMKNSMKKNMFYNELRNHPHAAQLYVNYLKQRHENIEALDFLGMLGKTEEAAMFKYELAISSSSDSQVKNLKNALKTHFDDPSLSFESRIVTQHLNLLETQTPIEATDSKDENNPVLIEHPRATFLVGQSLLTTLFYCSMYHWHSSDSLSMSPLSLKKEFSISDKQFLWTTIRARAKVKHWPLPAELENLLVARGLMGTLSNLSRWSGGGKTVKNIIPLDRIIDTLASSGAPSNILFPYINLMSTNEEKLRIGREYKCHLAVIEAYVGLNNREALEKYLKEIPLGSPEYIKAEHALKNTKWKS